MVARCKEDIIKAKGVKPTLSPNLNTLATVEALDVKKLLFIGVGCQVHPCNKLTSARSFSAFDSVHSQALFDSLRRELSPCMRHIHVHQVDSTCWHYRYKHCGQWKSIFSWRSCTCWAPTVWIMALGRAWTSSCRLPAPLLTPSCTMSSCRFAVAQHTHAPPCLLHPAVTLHLEMCS